MKCKQAETQVAAYADGELDALRTYSIKQHLDGCANCTAIHDNILVLRARIRAEVPKFVASPALHARVRATIGAVRAAVPAEVRQTGDVAEPTKLTVVADREKELAVSRRNRIVGRDRRMPIAHANR